MHLVFTSSYDFTTDMLVERLGDRVIRLNNDRPHDHEIQVGPGGFFISDAYGRRVSHETLTTAILRKPAPRIHSESDEKAHVFRETTTAHSALLQLIGHKWPHKLPINPAKVRDVGKFVQLDASRGFFATAPWAFSTHPEKSGLNDDVVLKTLNGMPFSDGKGKEEDVAYIYVQRAKLSELAEGWPWFLQERIDARFDLTVLYVDGKMFGKRLDRRTFEGLDWRKYIGTEMDAGWADVALPSALADAIDGYMRKLGLRFGRLDFLSKDERLEEVLFLEVNPNGQWAWMDMQMNNGIFDAVMEFLCVPRNC